MKTQIRKGVFETNSSSTHSLTICTQEEYDKWRKGELYFNTYKNEFVSIEEYDKLLYDSKDKMLKNEIDITNKDEVEKYISDMFGIVSYDKYLEIYLVDYEPFKERYKTKSGENIVAFGYYGYC